MILLKTILLEMLAEKNSEETLARSIARKMGLEYASFGRWKDPKTGKVVAKTIDGKLVRLDPKDHEDLDNSPSAQDKNMQSWGGMRKAVQSMEKPSQAPPPSRKHQERMGRTIDKLARPAVLKKLQSNPALNDKVTGLVKASIANVPDLPEHDAEYIGYLEEKGGLLALMQAEALLDAAPPDNRGQYSIEAVNPRNPDGRPTTFTFGSFEELWRDVQMVPRSGGGFGMDPSALFY